MFLFKISHLSGISKCTQYNLSCSIMSYIRPSCPLWPKNDDWGIWYLFKHSKLLLKCKNLLLYPEHSRKLLSVLHTHKHPLNDHWKTFFPLLMFSYKLWNQSTWSLLLLKTLESVLEIPACDNLQSQVRATYSANSVYFFGFTF